MFNSNWKDDFYLFQSCDTAPISNSSLETVCFFHRECPSVPQRDVDGQPLVIFTPLTWVRRTCPHKTITRAHRPSRGRDRSSLAPACVCRGYDAINVAWLRVQVSVETGYRTAEVSMVARCLSVSGCISVSARRFCTGIKTHPMDTGPVWETFYETSGMCQRSLARFPEGKKKKGKKWILIA